METRQLRYFVAVARANSFAKAASQIYVAQSALSRQIKQLETELDVRLFHRTSRGVELTEAGDTFLVYALSVLTHLDDAKINVKRSFDDPAGRVSLGIPPSVCNALAVPLLHAVSQQLPAVRLELTEEATGQLSDRLKRGLLAMAILFDDGTLEDLAAHALLDEQLYFLSKANGSKSGHGPSVSLKVALESPLFLASAQNGVRRIIEHAAREQGLPPPIVVSDINSVSILRGMVLAGIGSTILPPMSVKDELESRVIYGRPIVDPPLKRRVVLCRAKGIPATPAAEAVANVLVRLVYDLFTTQAWIKTSAMKDAGPGNGLYEPRRLKW